MAISSQEKWLISAQSGVVLYVMMHALGECGGDARLAALYAVVVRLMMG